MARVTVEDCIVRVPNRFDLVMLAAQRARSVSAGAVLTVERDNDKNPVIALREIADETIELDGLEDSLVKSLQKYVELEEPEEDEMDLVAIQQDLDGAAEMEEAVNAAPSSAADEAASDDANADDADAGSTGTDSTEAADGATEDTEV